ncbi:hypothetical protein AABV96_004968 [Salmonella enterica]|uniref:hypothetical protein n=3 Tax=Enterobacteriaceae TaxID=543 RepID=UPI0015568E8D|nr:hypothetical protein [Escherichia coli]EEP8762246.1 hypothetical protein [Salmonella enterica]EFP2569395.1 hypothetical protein [Salmonella enterica subsp. enterica serovar Rissen]EGF5640119.1 hypothetical protein [Salmonella enterica subsp. enterica serovar Worthington]EGN7741611.1 hypothetical protein [Salmonella enterica subsp. enterica serovar Idikan]EHH1525541.1 hypothetical protein [Salmonella enterica subsp. enterica serovar Putten]EHH2002992.1 hypothetical protein [Salmonella enter
MTKKSVPHCIVHACMNGLFFLTTELHRSFSSYITFTTLLQHSFGLYITFTTLLHHLYITFTSFLQLIRHFHPLCHLYITPFLNVLTAGFPAAPATLHGHAINCVPVHRFRMGRTPETGLPLAEWCEFPRYALARILMHAVKTEPARFWRVFGGFVACFTGFPSETPSEPLRRCTQGMLCLIGLTVRYKKKPLGGFFFAMS